MARQRSRSRIPIIGVLIAAILLFAAQLSDCLPGFGTGSDGASDGSRPDAAAQPEPTPTEDAETPEAGGVSIAVVGSQCRIPPAEAQTCDATCAGLAEDSDRARPITIDATQGSHGTVEQLRACLADAGFTAVEVRSQ